MTNLLGRFTRLVALLSQLCGVVAAGLIASAVVVVCQMVFLRYVLNETTIWQTDFVTYSLVAATFIGSPYVLLTRGHVNVDVLPAYLGDRARFYMALVAAIMSFAFCAIMTGLAWHFWHVAWSYDWVSDTMWRARLWIPYAAMPAGFFILSLQYVADIINLITGRDPPFGIKPEAAV
jgi:TRAP-type C4-dicarboxylate transport system permease small subunit